MKVDVVRVILVPLDSKSSSGYSSVLMHCKVYEDLEITYIDGYCYKARFLPWRNYVADNYRDRLVAKKNNDTFNTLFYKLLNNAGAYGKFLEKPHNEIFANDINALGIIDSNIIPKDEKDLKINARYTYIPVGSCIPAYSRVSLIETALLFGWKKIVYFDTDSIFCLLDMKHIISYKSLGFRRSNKAAIFIPFLDNESRN